MEAQANGNYSSCLRHLLEVSTFLRDEDHSMVKMVSMLKVASMDKGASMVKGVSMVKVASMVKVDKTAKMASMVKVVNTAKMASMVKGGQQGDKPNGSFSLHLLKHKIIPIGCPIS